MTNRHLSVIDGGMHEIQPDPATARRQVNGEPCSLLDENAYPVLAECTKCRVPIKAHSFYSDWYHDDDERPTVPEQASTP